MMINEKVLTQRHTMHCITQFVSVWKPYGLIGLFEYIIPPPTSHHPQEQMGGGGVGGEIYWNHSTASVSLCVWILSRGYLRTAQPLVTDLAWWYIIMIQSVRRKKLLSWRSRSQWGGGAGFKKLWYEWLFLLYLLNFWSICNQTWFDGTSPKSRAACENCIAVFKVKVTAKDQNINEWLSRSCLLNHLTFCYQTWYDDASLWNRVSYRKIVFYLQGQGHSKGWYDQYMSVTALSFVLLIL